MKLLPHELNIFFEERLQKEIKEQIKFLALEEYKDADLLDADFDVLDVNKDYARMNEGSMPTEKTINE